MRSSPTRGFTLVEVLIALSITAFVATIAYTSLSSAIAGVEAVRESAVRSSDMNRAWMIISRDIRQFVPREVRDEFGEREPAMLGGPAARYALSFSRGGWHNPNGLPRSHLQRVHYLVEEEALWRETWPVLDRAPDTPAQRVKLLEGVEEFEVLFLPSLDQLQLDTEGSSLDTRGWAENWVTDTSVPDAELPPPVALEIRLHLIDQGELRRVYALPPL